MSYCMARHEKGWYCILYEGHDKDWHLSMDNSKLWKGTPGFPVFWMADAPSEQDDFPRDPTTSEELNPTLTQGEYERARKEIARPQEQPTGDACGICGALAVIRESACRTRCRACGAIDGGCG